MLPPRSCPSSFPILVVTLLVAAGTAVAEEKDSVDRDYSKELPRIAPTEPAEALKTFTVAPGFKIELVAAEPLVTDPIALAFDEFNRLFVVEMKGYSEDGDKNLGQIRVLEDTDDDGLFDKSSVLIDGLSWPTAITCWDGGVFVGAAPNIFYFKDTDGDGRADVRRIEFTGFGRGNVQGLLNTFKWGLDNRIHGATSSSGATVTRGVVSEQPMKPLELRGRDFAFDPRTMEMQATSGGGQHGLSFDKWGNKFVCSNSNHIQYVLYEDRYLARNPYLAAPSPRVMIAADGPQADVFRTSPVEPWRIVRTRLRKQGIVPGPVEGGGTAAGYFTGSTGITMYRGDAWPEKYDGWAIVGDVGSNLVHRKRLEPDGVSFIARRVDEKSEFVSSSDIWFRPVQFANAPDGSLYIADMYREVIEHPLSLHPVIKKHLDLTSGRDRGRIYRVVPDGFKQPKPRLLGLANNTQLRASLGHRNGWRRETAARLLYERQDRRAIHLLELMSDDFGRPEGRIATMYTLNGLSALSPEIVLARLEDEHPRVREHAVRLAEHVAAESPQVREKLFSLVADPDLRVRYQLAFSLGELMDARKNVALAELLKQDANDGAMQMAVRSSLHHGSGAALTHLLRDNSFRRTKSGRETIKSLASQIGKQQLTGDVAAVIRAISSLPQDEKQTIAAIVEGLALKPGSALQQQIAAATGGRADEVAKQLVESATAVAVDSSKPPADRADAVYQLYLADYGENADVLRILLEPTQPMPVQTAALDTLAKYDAPEIAALLIDRWPSLTPATRSRAGDVLFSRSQWVLPLLEAIEDGRVKLGDVEPGRLKLLMSHSDDRIRELATRLAASTSAGPRADVLKDYLASLEIKGDAARGKAAFAKTCSKCHKIDNVGFEVGPNLAAMRNRGPEAILLNVIDPNREVNPQYVNYSIITKDGRQLTGMITAETATSVTLDRGENKTDTVLRIDIDDMRSSGLSLMPEGLEKEVDQQTMADLIEYLQTLQ